MTTMIVVTASRFAAFRIPSGFFPCNPAGSE
jgi:hypothetical protein